jgi:hypothetical protein
LAVHLAVRDVTDGAGNLGRSPLFSRLELEDGGEASVTSSVQRGSGTTWRRPAARIIAADPAFCPARWREGGRVSAGPAAYAMFEHRGGRLRLATSGSRLSKSNPKAGSARTGLRRAGGHGLAAG